MRIQRGDTVSFHPVMPGMRRIACVAAALLLATLFRVRLPAPRLRVKTARRRA